MNRTTHSRRGQALVTPLAWLFGVALFLAPFLRTPDAPDPEGDDPGRAVSEVDIPFAEDLALLAEELEIDLAGPLAEASERWFGAAALARADDPLVDVARAEAGRVVYQRHCVGCHGSTGDGAGPAARSLEPRPRNFRRGIFKFTSTPTGGRPLPDDLFDTVTRGLQGSSMPAFNLLPEPKRRDVVEYVRWVSIRGEFEQLALDLAWEDEEEPDLDEVAEIVSERWSPELVRAVYPSAAEPLVSAESVERGRALYFDTTVANCATCHGDTGVGDGPSATAFLDGWGYPVAPRDLTTGVYRAGSSSADLYRSIATGINGTPMPAYDGSLEPEAIWDLVHFVKSLARTNR